MKKTVHVHLLGKGLQRMPIDLVAVSRREVAPIEQMPQRYSVRGEVLRLVA